MNKYKKSIKRGDSKSDNVEPAPVRKSMKLDIGNDSPQHSYDSRVSGHSTPIHRRDYALDIEDSPELDYHCSPISLPCTQDGGNEIAWDWQISNSKSSNDKIKSQNNRVETPKRTKQLQKKRNSNSPLLQKPLKRKQVKKENIENIGKLAAELKALSEKMKSMQENCRGHEENKDEEPCEFESKLLIELDEEHSDDIMADVDVNDERSKVDSIAVSSEDKKSSNYDDLFDDSVNDSMVKCTQEIEEKLNLCKGKQIDITELPTASEKSLTTSNNSTETSKSSSSNASGHLKTYSNNSSKTNSLFHASKSNAKHFNNNVTNVSDGKQKFQDKTVAEFPDDSFDDCLATCIEDDKLMSKLSEYDFSPSKSSHNASHSRRSLKQVAPNASNNKRVSKNLFTKPVAHNDRSNNYKNSVLITDELADEIEVINDKETIQKLLPGTNAFENRKFFKTKSLSDQCFYQSRNISKSVKASNSVAASESQSQLNSVNPSVSSTFPVVKGQNLHKNNNFPSTNGMENARTLNRLEENGAGNGIVKYKSTSNLSNIKEAKELQSVQCTPEEIEKKRLDAKMRLEAKRKLQQTNIRTDGTPTEGSVKKSVKR